MRDKLETEIIIKERIKKIEEAVTELKQIRMLPKQNFFNDLRCVKVIRNPLRNKSLIEVFKNIVLAHIANQPQSEYQY